MNPKTTFKIFLTLLIILSLTVPFNLLDLPAPAKAQSTNLTQYQAIKQKSDTPDLSQLV